MFLYKYRRKILKKFKNEYNYQKTLYRSSKINPGEKRVFIDVSDITLNRYLYNFLKFFQLNGYTVYLPKSRRIIGKLNEKKGEFKYTSWLIKENFVKFQTPPIRESVLYISKEQLSNDYFSSFFETNIQKDTYHIPMSEYCSLYHKGIWIEEFLIDEKRKRSVFMAGNINPQYYDKITAANFFNIISRKKVADHIKEQKYYKPISSVLDLKRYIYGEEDNQMILIDTSVNFTIKGSELKNILKRFDFYLALPGIIIPQSHNLIEAMSVGNIPILHKTYAAFLCPPLTNNTDSFTYETLEELDAIIKNVFSLSEEKILIMRKNVINYYNLYLSPTAVINEIENNQYSKIFLQAEKRSLIYLRNKGLN